MLLLAYTSLKVWAVTRKNVEEHNQLIMLLLHYEIVSPMFLVTQNCLKSKLLGKFLFHIFFHKYECINRISKQYLYYYFFYKTNRLATSYIDYLMQLLNSENVGSNAISGFKADIHKRWKEKSEDQKRRELVSKL